MISIILIEPQFEGNIGAIARSMKNFGFSELILVNPKCTIGEETRCRAKHANDIIDEVKIFTDLILMILKLNVLFVIKKCQEFLMF